MPRFFFNVRNSVVLDDPEGRDCPDEAAAREYAIMECRQLAAHDVRLGRLNLKHRIEVVDDKGIALFAVTFADAVTVEH